MKRLLPSRLKHRVTLQEPLLTADGQGGYTRSWQDVADLWAEISPVERLSTQIEALQDERLQSRTTHRVTMRYRPGVQPDMRLLYGTRVLSIRSVLNTEEAQKTLVLLTEEEVGV